MALPADADTLDTPHWDEAAMAPLDAPSRAAVARLRAFTPPPFPLWDRLPPRRRGAVLVLLYPDQHGALRVVVTMRGAAMRSFPNQAALPGGKSDSVDEEPYTTARREACEEIGFPDLDTDLPPPFRIEHLCDLPHFLSINDLVVRPCVALLDVDPDLVVPSPTASPSAPAILPRPDGVEVAAVFSAPFRDFLSTMQAPRPGEDGPRRPEPPGDWYGGTWKMRREMPYRLHHFYVPVHRQRLAMAGPVGATGLGDGPDVWEVSASEQDADPREQTRDIDETVNGDNGDQGNVLWRRFKVWGFTAHVLVDAARVAYGHDPEQEHNPHFGDEDLICAAALEWEWLRDKPDGEHRI